MRRPSSGAAKRSGQGALEQAPCLRVSQSVFTCDPDVERASEASALCTAHAFIYIW